MTKEELIKEALIRANQGLIGDNEIANYNLLYDTELDAALAQHKDKWLFSYDITSLLDQTTDGNDLGYQYKYLVPGDTLSVICINPESSFRFISAKEALKYGYAVTNEDLAFSYSTNNQYSFLLIDSPSGPILHTDVEVTKILYSKKVTPVVMDPLFRKFFILQLAYTIGTVKDPGNHALNDKLEAKAKKAHIAALTPYLKRPVDPQLAAIYDWVKTYTIQTTARY